jgi:hypothetical protein
MGAWLRFFNISGSCSSSASLSSWARMIAGLPTTWRSTPLVQDVPQHGRVLASQDHLPFQLGADGTVDRGAAVSHAACPR